MLCALGSHVFLVSKILTLRAQLSGVHVGLGDEGPGWEALRKKLWTSRVRVIDSQLATYNCLALARRSHFSKLVSPAIERKYSRNLHGVW